ncbi:MAG: FG-GAP-like repeat-containing protein [Oscillospiraceae bacterium]|nr:FG-GAP-like repeat-containing protein [Oscillospiraceae bacterium]
MSSREDKNAKGFHTWQANKARTGFCDVKGAISNPSVSFEMDISGKRHIFSYAYAHDINGGSATPGNIRADGEFIINITSPGEGSVESVHERTGYFLPGVKELQKISCDTSFKSLDQDNLKVRFYIFNNKNGWELKWESEHINMLFFALPIVADIDNDGRVELAVFPWYDVVVFDLETGTQKYKSRFINEKVVHGRAYGLVGAYDAFNDGRKEIFIIPNTCHMAMMGWDGNELKLKWTLFFEEDCSVMKTAYSIPENAVMDIDGDGNLEVLTSVYNWHGDGKWHIYFLNAVTGEVILDIPDRYLYDNINTDADKNGNWLTASMKTSGRRINKFGDLNFMKFYRETENGKLMFRDVWEQKKSEFSSRVKVVRDNNMNNIMFTATDPIRLAKIGEGKYAFATTFYHDASKIDTTLILWGIENGEIKKMSEIRGKRLKMLGNVNTPPYIVSDVAFNESSELIYDNCILNYVSTSHIKPTLGGASAGQFIPGKPLSVFVEDAVDNMVAFTLGEKKGETELCLVTPGRAMFYGATGSTHQSGYMITGVGYELSDVDGDGYVEAISAWGAESGNAELRVTKYDGSVILRHELDDVPSERPHWNTGGLCMWTAGNFLGNDRIDIFITMRFGNAPSGRLINLKTNKAEWVRSHNDIGNIFGGTMVSVTDFDGDGLDDLVFTYTQSVYSVDGATGETIMNQPRNPDHFPALGNMNMSLDIDGDGKSEIIYAGDPHLLGLTGHDGKFRWAKTPVKSENNAATGGVMPAVFDCDGDGELEMILPFVPVKEDFYIKCYNIKTGDEKWALKMDKPIHQSVGGTLAADIDGDGKLELIFTNGEILTCYGFGSDNVFSKKWEYNLPDVCGYPIIVDFGENGGVQIVVTCADGKVYGIK